MKIEQKESTVKKDTSVPSVQKQLNSNLHKAKREKNDEFYTQLSDIENELRHYKPHFKGKTVLCNCDDPRVSNFFHYFSHNFEHLGLKKLIATCYKSQDLDSFSQNNSEKAIYMEYSGFEESTHVPNFEAIGVNYLNGDGDFRSEECIELLKQADIVVTNPPFSLFREYVSQLVEYDKKFLILGTLNAITYKEIFKLIKENKIWLGINNGSKQFEVCQHYDLKNGVETKNDKKYFNMGNVIWYTNLDFPKRHEDLILTEKYTPEEFPKYDNYDAINVNLTKNIPMDYGGYIGVPITFLNKYNPEQFEIIGQMTTTKKDAVNFGYPYVNGKKIYARVIIKNKRLNS